MYVFGGLKEGSYSNDLYEYNFKKNKWRKIIYDINKKVLQPRSCHSANVYNDHLFIFGGKLGSTKYSNKLFKYSFEKYHWSEVLTDNKPPSCCKHDSFMINNMLFAVGGKKKHMHSKNYIYKIDLPHLPLRSIEKKEEVFAFEDKSLISVQTKESGSSKTESSTDDTYLVDGDFSRKLERDKTFLIDGIDSPTENNYIEEKEEKEEIIKRSNSLPEKKMNQKSLTSQQIEYYQITDLLMKEKTMENLKGSCPNFPTNPIKIPYNHLNSSLENVQERRWVFPKNNTFSPTEDNSYSASPTFQNSPIPPNFPLRFSPQNNIFPNSPPQYNSPFNNSGPSVVFNSPPNSSPEVNSPNSPPQINSPIKIVPQKNSPLSPTMLERSSLPQNGINNPLSNLFVKPFSPSQQDLQSFFPIKENNNNNHNEQRRKSTKLTSSPEKNLNNQVKVVPKKSQPKKDSKTKLPKKRKKIIKKKIARATIKKKGRVNKQELELQYIWEYFLTSISSPEKMGKDVASERKNQLENMQSPLEENDKWNKYREKVFQLKLNFIEDYIKKGDITDKKLINWINFLKHNLGSQIKEKENERLKQLIEESDVRKGKFEWSKLLVEMAKTPLWREQIVECGGIVVLQDLATMLNTDMKTTWNYTVYKSVKPEDLDMEEKALGKGFLILFYYLFYYLNFFFYFFLFL